jgi:hypothetical protein
LQLQIANIYVKKIKEMLLPKNAGVVVEANGRGMLHLHSLLWVRGNTAFTTLCDRLTEDSSNIKLAKRAALLAVQSCLNSSLSTSPEVSRSISYMAQLMRFMVSLAMGGNL